MDTQNDDDVAQEVETPPSWVTEGTEEDLSVEGENLGNAEQREPMSDVIEPAKGVEFTITDVRAEQYTPQGKNDWMKFQITPWLVIGEKGIDGKGRYKNKHFFPRMLVAVNRKSSEYDFTVNAQGKPSDFYAAGGNAFGDYTAFLQALGLPTNPAPKNDAAFRKSLVGKKLIADIVKDRRRVKDNVTGKYEYVDEYENKLLYKPASKQQQGSAPVVAEAAAS